MNIVCFQENKNFRRKLAAGTEAVSVLVGQVDFLSSLPSSTTPSSPPRLLLYLGRLRQGCVLGDWNEVDAPTRFLAVLLVAKASGEGAGGTGIGAEAASLQEAEQLGRALASMFADKVNTLFYQQMYQQET
jgi:hypothetical protein